MRGNVRVRDATGIRAGRFLLRSLWHLRQFCGRNRRCHRLPSPGPIYLET